MEGREADDMFVAKDENAYLRLKIQRQQTEINKLVRKVIKLRVRLQKELART